ncbi:hypothetical protein CC85DRAFT_130322 [Cutaneotrichosporon oleaginosum]|uniref:Uncharacterized protein n=1 Tax=Cutaneotrichosporon oleaginosum TaxID=879819 RepID=A0A0J0XIY9_9TREE|nr:uncharacterized protein CC85DRAFT_130322 [Cutaneotrichosporon oleaginosum]KLT41060.1 hypothetical protein CC85DRAFT_130322 [Cutaneotrichosporon oleaginosum]TXT12152.1 hypothetical protein COLE_02562 [Cutaneotrichosporon oleaginosum]
MSGRYPASLSRRPVQQRPPRPTSSTPSSIDDEVPSAPLPELASLELLLRQAGYKETRVFTPEAERTRPRLKTRLDDEDSAELANMYAAMGLDPEASIQVRHLTQPSVPFRSSSSVLRNVALQDATAMLNEVRKRRGAGTQEGPGVPKAADAFWRPEILDRAAAEAMGKHIATISPPRNRNSTDGVGLGLAQQGRGVRKAKSNMELVRNMPPSPGKEDVPPGYYTLHRENQPPTAPAHTTAFQREVPPSIAAMFSPPTTSPLQSEQPQFVDDAFDWGQLPADYESQEIDDDYAEMYGSGGDSDSDSIVSSISVRSSLSLRRARSVESPPLLDTDQVLAELGLGPAPARDTDGESLAGDEEIAEAEAEAAAIGQRILATTVEYDDDDSEDEFDPNSSPTPNTQLASAVPVFNVTSPSPPSRKPMLPPSPSPAAARLSAVQRAPATRAAPPMRTPRKVVSREVSLAEAMSESIISPPKLAKPVVLPASPLRASKSVPVLRKQKSFVPFSITPAALAAPSLQTVAPVLCDSISNDAEDLPPLPIPPMNDAAPTSSIGYIALKARKSLSALRASFWATAPEGQLPSTSTAPILAPRLDWGAQGAQFAGWNTDQDEKQHKSRGSVESTSSVDTMREIDTFDDSCPIDYTKSFFYKPTTPPRPFNSVPSRASKLSKQASVKSLRRALQIPVAAPPVPRIPSKYLTASNANLRGARTPPRLQPPEIRIHSPGAFEEGRPPRALSLTGQEWEGRDVVPNWGKGVRKRSRNKRSRPRNPFSDDWD